MKRKLLSISGLMLVTTVLFAQAPNFTSSYHPNPGSTAYEQFASSSGVSLGTSGTAQTWNYTSLSDSGSLITGTPYVAASSTPSYWSSIFPGANLADGSNSSGYLYTETGSNSWVILGFAGTSTGDTLIYSVPETLFQYPFTYQSSFSTSFAASETSTEDGVTALDTRTGTDTFNADGYGTLDLPGGSNYVFPNVLRTVLIEDYRDIQSYDGTPYDTVYERVSTVDYLWAGNTTQPLLSISTITITEEGISESGNSVYYYPNTNTGINDITPLVQNLNVFPNPSYSQSTVALSLKDEATINVYVSNIIGQRVKTITTEQADAGDHTYTIETSDMAKGLYLVTVEINGAVAAIRKLEME
jgi:hypothetical protein